MLRRFALVLLFALAAAPALAVPAGTIGEEARLDPAAQVTLRRALQGDAAAQHNLGNMYEYGKGVPKDYGQALKWYEMAAEQGLPYSQHALSDMIRQGLGTPVDAPRAAEWVAKAAEQGLAISQHNLALMYEFGFGVTADKVKALAWFALAAELHEEADRKAAAEEGIARVGGSLGPGQIAEAETLVQAWLAKPRKQWPSLGEPTAGR